MAQIPSVHSKTPRNLLHRSITARIFVYTRHISENFMYHMVRTSYILKFIIVYFGKTLKCEYNKNSYYILCIFVMNLKTTWIYIPFERIVLIVFQSNLKVFSLVGFQGRINLSHHCSTSVWSDEHQREPNVRGTYYVGSWEFVIIYDIKAFFIPHSARDRKMSRKIASRFKH